MIDVEMFATQNDPRADILSPEFDPEYALAVPQVAVPFPNEMPLNNISECRQLLPSRGTVMKHLKPGSKHHAVLPIGTSQGAASHGAATSSAALSSAVPSASRQRAQTFSQQLKDSFPDASLGILRKWKHQRVRVLIRRKHGLRGWYEGRLQLFDKHWNMLLLEVTEHSVEIRSDFWPHLRVDALEPPLNAAEGLESLACWKQQHIKQLFLSGDSIISLCPLPQLGSWPPPKARAAFQSVAARSALATFQECHTNSSGAASISYG